MDRPLPVPRRRPLLVAVLLWPLLLAASAPPPPVTATAGTAPTATAPGPAGPGAVLPVAAGPVAAARAAPRWQAPVPGTPDVVRPFAPGPQAWSPGHRGVDLALPAGALVLAAGPGRVVFAGPVAGRGVVSVSHGDLRTTYEPVLPAVARGDVVAAGDVLGSVAAGHQPCGACLHWGLRRGDHYLDPLRLLRPARVRLLPLSGTPR